MTINIKMLRSLVAESIETHTKRADDFKARRLYEFAAGELAVATALSEMVDMLAKCTENEDGS